MQTNRSRKKDKEANVVEELNLGFCKRQYKKILFGRKNLVRTLVVIPILIIIALIIYLVIVGSIESVSDLSDFINELYLVLPVIYIPIGFYFISKLRGNKESRLIGINDELWYYYKASGNSGKNSAHVSDLLRVEQHYKITRVTDYKECDRYIEIYGEITKDGGSQKSNSLKLTKMFEDIHLLKEYLGKLIERNEIQEDVLVPIPSVEKTDNKFCTNCGKKVKSNFCTRCGFGTRG